MKGSKDIEYVSVGAVTLATEGNDLVVSVEHDGSRYEVIRTLFVRHEDDGEIYHSVMANGLAAIFDGQRV